MGRRLIPRDQMGARLPLLVLSLAMLFLAFVLVVTDHAIGGMTAFVAAFLLVAAAKRA